MGKRLVITEKPSVARDIAAALGGFESEDEHMESDEYVLTWAIGHLLELSEPEDYDPKFKDWMIKDLPVIPEAYTIKPRDGQKTRLKHIQKLGKRKDVDGIINACDAGREGELIFRRTVEYTGLDRKPIERLWLQSMTPDAIRTAFDELRDGQELQPLADAAWLRAVGDWLIGMNATRALTKRLRGRRERGVWSAGRVQTPTLALLVEREREIMAHEPKPYWEVVATFAKDTQVWQGKWYDPALEGHPDREVKPTRLFDEAHAKRIVEVLNATGAGQASETRKKSTQKPPLPFDLTALQREANRRFSFSAKRTLDAAQRLYEGHKMLTYPRTDSRHLPGDYGPTVSEVLQALTGDVDVQAVARKVLDDGPRNLDRILDDSKVSDHFAIVPTGNESERTLSPDDARIYGLVVRQFLASLMGPATWAVVERIVEVPVDGRTERFRTRERTLEEPGFFEALHAGKQDDDKDVPPKLPPLVAGKRKVDGVEVEVHDAESEAKETRPPGRYSEAQLLRMMETAGKLIDDDDLAEAMRGKGLGTPATRADTIEGLVRKQYARRVGGKLGPTSKALRLLDILGRLDVGAIAQAELTGQLEYQLELVQEGQLARKRVLGELEELTRDITGKLAGFDYEDLYAGEGDLGRCPSCDEGVVIENAWGYHCSTNTGRDAECRFIVWKDRGGRYIDRETARKLIADRKVGPLTGFWDKSGRELEGTIFLDPPAEEDERRRWQMRVEYGESAWSDEPEEVQGRLMPDPEDPDSWILETNKRFVSERLYENKVKKAPVLPKIVCHREISIEEARAFFGEEGKTPILDGFISRRGNPFRGALFRKPTGKHGFEFPPREGKKKTTAKKKTTKRKTTAKKKTTTAAAKKKATTTAAKKKASTAKKTTSTTAKKTTSKKKATTAAKKKASTAKKGATAAAKKKASTAKKAAATAAAKKKATTVPAKKKATTVAAKKKASTAKKKTTSAAAKKKASTAKKKTTSAAKKKSSSASVATDGKG